MITMKRFQADTYAPHTPPTYPTREMKELFQAVLALKTEQEAANFFRDLLTIAELDEFANRWQVVKLLMDGMPYAKIATKLNVSTATVTRVAHWLNDGMGGYKLIAARTESTSKPQKKELYAMHTGGKRWKLIRK